MSGTYLANYYCNNCCQYFDKLSGFDECCPSCGSTWWQENDEYMEIPDDCKED